MEINSDEQLYNMKDIKKLIPNYKKVLDFADKFSENSNALYELLLFTWEHNLDTVACCGSYVNEDEIENINDSDMKRKRPYITFNIKRKDIEIFSYIIEWLTNPYHSCHSNCWIEIKNTNQFGFRITFRSREFNSNMFWFIKSLLEDYFDIDKDNHPFKGNHNRIRILLNIIYKIKDSEMFYIITLIDKFMYLYIQSYSKEFIGASVIGNTPQIFEFKGWYIGNGIDILRKYSRNNIVKNNQDYKPFVLFVDEKLREENK